MRPADADRHGDLGDHAADRGLQLAGERQDVVGAALAELHEHDHRVAVRGRDEQQVALREELVDRPVQALLDVLDDRLLLVAQRRRPRALKPSMSTSMMSCSAPRLEPEEGEPAGDLLFVEVAGDELVEEVAGEALLGLGDGLLLDQLERGDRDHVVQDDAVVVGELAAVLDHGEEGADAVRGHDRVDLHAAAAAVRRSTAKSWREARLSEICFQRSAISSAGMRRRWAASQSTRP